MKKEERGIEMSDGIEETEVQSWFVTDEDYENVIDDKYNEDNAIKQLKAYIDSTYNQHYSQNKFQATEFIIDGGHGDGFCIGNIMKYAQRYGNKDGYNRKDLMKVLHYAIIQLHVHDQADRG